MINYDCLWGGETHCNGACRRNTRQSTRAGTCKANTSRCSACAHQWHAQAGAGHARIQALGLCRLTGLRGRTRKQQGPRDKARHGYVLTEGMQWKHPGKDTWLGALPFSAHLVADRVCCFHLRSTTPVESGRGWPARTYSSGQPGVL